MFAMQDCQAVEAADVTEMTCHNVTGCRNEFWLAECWE